MKACKRILLVLWMGMIFYFSSQTAAESAESSNTLIELIYKIYAFLADGKAADSSVFILMLVQPIRKLAHFTEFMILGFLIYLNMIDFRKDKVLAYSLLFGICYACSDEIHQLFVLNRYCSLMDILIDSLGSATAIFLCHLITKR